MKTIDSWEIMAISGGNYCACISKTPLRGMWDGVTILGIAYAAKWVYEQVDYQLAAKRCRQDNQCIGVADGVEKCREYLGKEEFLKCT